MKILILISVLTFALCQLREENLRFDSKVVAGNGILGYDFSTKAVIIEWKLLTSQKTDFYLVDETNFKLLKGGSPFRYYAIQKSSNNYTGTFSNEAIIRNKVIITVKNTNPTSVVASYYLTQYLPRSSSPQTFDTVYIVLISFAAVFGIVVFIVLILWVKRRTTYYGRGGGVGGVVIVDNTYYNSYGTYGDSGGNHYSGSIGGDSGGYSGFSDGGNQYSGDSGSSGDSGGDSGGGNSYN